MSDIGPSASARLSRVAGTLAIELVGAAAQGALAAIGGALVRALGTTPSGSTSPMPMTPMSRWLLGVHITPRALAVAGLVCVVARGVTQAWALAIESASAAEAAGKARTRLLASALGSPSDSASLGRVVTAPERVAEGVLAERERLRAGLSLGVLAAVALALDTPLAVALLLAVLPFALLLGRLRRSLRKAHAEASSGATALIDASRDVLEHAALWASCGAATTALARVEKLGGQTATFTVRAATRQSLASTLNEAAAALAAVVLVTVFAPGTSAARPTLLPLLITLISSYRPLRAWAEAAPKRVRASLAEEELAALPAPMPLDERPARWPADRLALEGVQLDRGRGLSRQGIDAVAEVAQPLAIAGSPGAGKSSLLEALAGLRPIGGGAIRYGTRRLDGARPGPARWPVAYVPPSPPVMPGTLADNLAPDAPGDEQRIARARDVLAALGDEALGSLADDAALGGGGRKPSSGECQRIGLARAMASDAPVLLLDEPSAHLDASTEAKLVELLRRLSETRVIVVASHRAAVLSLGARLIDLDAPADAPAPPS